MNKSPLTPKGRMKKKKGRPLTPEEMDFSCINIHREKRVAIYRKSSRKRSLSELELEMD